MEISKLYKLRQSKIADYIKTTETKTAQTVQRLKEDFGLDSATIDRGIRLINGFTIHPNSPAFSAILGPDSYIEPLDMKNELWGFKSWVCWICRTGFEDLEQHWELFHCNFGPKKSPEFRCWPYEMGDKKFYLKSKRQGFHQLGRDNVSLLEISK